MQVNFLAQQSLLSRVIRSSLAIGLVSLWSLFGYASFVLQSDLAQQTGLQQRLLLVTVLLTLLAAGLSWWLLRAQLAAAANTGPAEAAQQEPPEAAVSLPMPGEMGQPVSAFNTPQDRLAQQAQQDRLAQQALAHSQATLARTETIVGMGNWQWDLATQTMSWSDGMFALMGADVGSTAPALADQARFYEASDFQQLQDAVATTQGTGEPFALELRVVRTDGTQRICLVRGQAERGPDQQVLRLNGSLQDITEQKQTDLKLQQAASIFRHCQEGITVTDLDGTILDVNLAFSRITGYQREEALGNNPRMHKSDRQDASFYQSLWRELKRSGHWSGEVWNRRKNGEVYAEWLHICPVRDENGIVFRYVGLFTDISARQANADPVRKLAFFDALTGLPNRRLLTDRLGQAMLLNQRSGHQGAVILLDLDGFKPLNDTHDHPTGDLLLIEVARRLKACVRQVDTVARICGDEYVVLLSDLSADMQRSTEQARTLAENVRQCLAGPYLLTLQHQGQADVIVEHRCSASVGVVMFGPTEGDLELVLKRADSAMYQAKAAGRNRVVFFQGSA